MPRGPLGYGRPANLLTRFVSLVQCETRFTLALRHKMMIMLRRIAILAWFLFHVSASSAEPLAGAIIVVDPGHGGQRYSKSYTGGTRGAVLRLTESELNLRVAVELAKLLT